MDNTIQSDLIRGHIDTIILKALYDGDRYGFDIIKEIEQKSSGQYILKQPTLYSCLKRLEVQGFIKSYWGAKTMGGRRKYYTLTDMGKDLFIKNQSEWVYSRTVIDKLISDKDFDMSTIRSEENTDTESANIIDEDNASQVQNETTALDNDHESEVLFEDNSQNIDSDEIVDGESFSETLAEQEVPETFQSYRKQIIDRPYLDTTAIMNEMFEKQNDEGSYTDKIKNEQYVPTETIDPENYFSGNYFDETSITNDETETNPNSYEPEEKDFNVNRSEPTVNDNYAQSTYDSDAIYYDQQNELSNKNDGQPSPTTEFYSYDSEVSRTDENTIIINREYKNILCDLRDKNIIDAAKAKTVSSESIEDHGPEPEKEPASDFDLLDDDSDDGYENDTSDDMQLSDDKIRTRNFKKLESDVKDLGDGVKIRTHSSYTAKEYTNTYYFYSNKLMLSHYLVLFILMLLEICITFFAVVFGSGVEQKHALLFFILAVILALAFPSVAFIMNLIKPEKKRRITFNFKISMLFRVIVMIEALVLIYAVNIMIGMPATFSKNYLATLLIPAILTVNIPISAMIFQSLYKSGKYNVD